MLNWREKKVLVTGGTGSFGNFIVRRLLDMGVKEVRVMSRDEKKQYDMRVLYGNREDLGFSIGDIRNRLSVDEAMEGIDVVFQAAALKQVPTCEHFPMEAVQTNVLGVENVMQSALKHNVERMVTISTDKAVKPVNVMGMTKALQERLVLNGNLLHTNKGTKLACVRYGNVLRSRGSVVPLFRRQLSLGQKLTFTDMNMTRFLLTLNDAIDLVLYAAESTDGGEIFVRKAPAARIVDLGKILSEEAGKPFEYKVIGSLPGEKINEILVSEEELERTSDCGLYYKIAPWWSKDKPRAIDKEYSSFDALTDMETARDLITRSDREFETMQLPSGEFAKF
jgi:UDP-N-acetylglucosamine 4,6-dehydratase/5-epimerase